MPIYISLYESTTDQGLLSWWLITKKEDKLLSMSQYIQRYFILYFDYYKINN